MPFQLSDGTGIQDFLLGPHKQRQHRSTERGGKRYVQPQDQAHRSPVLVRELIKRKKIILHHKPTQQMLVDIATNHLSKQRFRELLEQSKDFTC